MFVGGGGGGGGGGAIPVGAPELLLPIISTPF